MPDVDHKEEALKHLRRVYSWLVIIQAGLLLAAAADTDRTLDAAIDQSRAIVRFAQGWDDRWIEERAKSLYDSTQQLLGDRWPRTLDQYHRFRLAIDGAPPGIIKAPLPVQASVKAFTLHGSKGVSLPRPPDVRPPMSFNSVLIHAAPTTIEDFEAL